MKAQKLPEAPEPGIGAELDVLRTAAELKAPGERAGRRLTDLQALFAEDLAWVERSLLDAAETGPAPGSDAARHLLAVGGKRVRPLCLLLSAACFGGVTDAARELAVVAELVHTATLLHDDVVDDGVERRGAHAARVLWGNGVSVLGGDLLLVHALDRTSRVAPAVMPELIATLRRLVEGEILQLRGRVELDVSEGTYQRILRDKTASLFAWSARSGALVAGATPSEITALGVFGEELGVAFQLVDDVLDYTGERAGKTLFADLREGKLTLPLVLAVAEDPALAAPLGRIFTGDRDPVSEVSRAVVASGTCEKVRKRAAEHTQKAVQALGKVRVSPARALLESVARALAERST